MASELRLELRAIYKRFGTTQALDGATLGLRAGEVHALLGQNGAGKSTLMGVLYGLVQPDAGEIRLDGNAVEIASPARALELGIGLVHQHPQLVPGMSVAENLVLGERGSFGLSPATRRARALERLARFDLDLDPDALVGELPVGRQQRLEICRALTRGARLLVLDEPTAALAPQEVRGLLELMGRLRDAGHTLVFISHKLREIDEVCDRVTVLRAGRVVATAETREVDARTLGRWMVGEDVPGAGTPPETEVGGPVLRLAGARTPGLQALDLELRAGELLAVAGIEGNGQEPLQALLAGVVTPVTGEVQRLAGPVALLSGDRQRTGLVLDLSLAENLALEAAARAGALTLLRPAELAGAAERAIARFDIRATPTTPVGTLSGGNQQKVCIARALRADPRVLIAVNPTRGLDVGATASVRAELRRAAREGCAVLLISTDLDEVLELGQRLLVLFRGGLVEVPPTQRTRERVGELMLGAAA